MSRFSDLYLHKLWTWFLNLQKLFCLANRHLAPLAKWEGNRRRIWGVACREWRSSCCSLSPHSFLCISPNAGTNMTPWWASSTQWVSRELTQKNTVFCWLSELNSSLKCQKSTRAGAREAVELGGHIRRRGKQNWQHQWIRSGQLVSPDWNLTETPW